MLDLAKQRIAASVERRAIETGIHIKTVEPIACQYGPIGRRNRHPPPAAFAPALTPDQQRDTDPGGGSERRDGGQMLPCQDFRRRHERRLPARLDYRRSGKERHQRLAGTDIAV